jgi:hypothetical protein
MLESRFLRLQVWHPLDKTLLLEAYSFRGEIVSKRREKEFIVVALEPTGDDGLEQSAMRLCVNSKKSVCG